MNLSSAEPGGRITTEKGSTENTERLMGNTATRCLDSEARLRLHQRRHATPCVRVLRLDLLPARRGDSAPMNRSSAQAAAVGSTTEQGNTENTELLKPP